MKPAQLSQQVRSPERRSVFNRVALSSVLTLLTNGLVIRQNATAGGLPITRIETIRQGNIDQTRFGYAGVLAGERDEWLLQPGDILFSHLNSIPHVGKCAIYQGEPSKLLHGMNLLCLRADREIIDAHYLLYALRDSAFRAQLSRVIKPSIDQASVTIKDLGKLMIPLPSRAVQQRIAEILIKADAIGQKRREISCAVDQLPISIFQEIFGDLARFPRVKIEQIAASSRYALSSGPFGSNLTSAHYTENGVMVLRGLNVSPGRLKLNDVKYISASHAERLSRSEIRGGDVVVVAVGNSGLACEIPDQLPRAVISQNFNKITPDITRVLPAYLAYCLNSPFVRQQFHQQITNTVRSFLSLTKLKQIELPLAPYELQEKFMRAIRKFEIMQDKYLTAVEEAEQLFESLSQRAFCREL